MNQADTYKGATEPNDSGWAGSPYDSVLTESDDSTLVQQICRGNVDAFEVLDRRYRRRLCAFLSRHTSCNEHAEDVAQRTLIKAFEAITTLQSGDKLAAWLYRIAYHYAIDDARARKPVSLGEERDFVSQQREPGEVMIQEEERKNLWNIAQKRLTGDEYTAIWLKYAENMRVEAICKVMERTSGSVRVLLFRARQKLYKELGGVERE